MRFAIPVENGNLFQHFGHCKTFAIIDVDQDSKQIVGTSQIDAPEHQPGLLPPWLKERGVTHVIAGGLGGRARTLLQEVSIETVGGAPTASVKALVRQYLDGTLVPGESHCGHNCSHD